MIRRVLKTSLLTLMLVFACSMPVFAEKLEGDRNWPFDIQLDMDTCERLFYGGHRGANVDYLYGYVITPETGFAVHPLGEDALESLSNYEISISVIFENDQRTGAVRELTRKFEFGDLEADTNYLFFSDNSKAELDRRGKLFSNCLRSIEMKISAKSGEKTEKNIYFEVCNDEDYEYYLDKAESESYFEPSSGEEE